MSRTIKKFDKYGKFGKLDKFDGRDGREKREDCADSWERAVKAASKNGRINRKRGRERWAT